MPALPSVKGFSPLSVDSSLLLENSFVVEAFHFPWLQKPRVQDLVAVPIASAALSLLKTVLIVDLQKKNIFLNYSTY